MLILADVLDRLQCCYLETVTQNIENAVTLITDEKLLSKQNDLFNLIHIFEDIDWDNKEETDKYLRRVNDRCGCDFVYEPTVITETDSPVESFSYKWVGDKPTYIKQPEIWIGIEPECVVKHEECDTCSDCDELYEWVPIEPECVVEREECDTCTDCEELYEWIPIDEYCVEQPSQPEEPCGCDE